MDHTISIKSIAYIVFYISNKIVEMCKHHFLIDFILTSLYEHSFQI